MANKTEDLRILLARDAATVELGMCLYRVLLGNSTKSERMIALEKEYQDGLSPALNIIGRVGKSKICAIFDHLIHIGDPSLIGRLHPELDTLRREVRLQCGIADRVLHHEDGVITVVEIKACGSRRDHAQGLGQVLMCAAAIREETSTLDVQCALFVGGDRDVWVENACTSAGVAYINIPFCVEQVIDEYCLLAKRMELA